MMSCLGIQSSCDRFIPRVLLGASNIFAGAPNNFLNGKNAPGFFLHYKRFFFRKCALYAIFLAFVSLVFCFWCGIISSSWVRCERLGAVKVPVLSIVVIVGGIRGTKMVVPLLGMYGSVTDQVDP